MRFGDIEDSLQQLCTCNYKTVYQHVNVTQDSCSELPCWLGGCFCAQFVSEPVGPKLTAVQKYRSSDQSLSIVFEHVHKVFWFLECCFILKNSALRVASSKK